MNWQRSARWAVALVGVGTAVALYVYTRPRPDAPPTPPPLTNADPAATAQASSGVNIRTVGETERYRLEHSGEKVFADGHVEWERPHLTFKEDKTEAWADKAIVKRAPKETQAPASLDLQGHVRLRTGEGATVEGDKATYDDTTGLTSIPGPVTFSRGRMSGSGEGAVYERDAGVFRLLAKAHVTTVADAANPDPVDAVAETLVFNRATKALQFDTRARITRSAEVMTADRATLYMSEDEQWFRLIELRGGSRVEALPGKKSETPDMRADDIDLAFYEATQVLEHGVLTGQARLTLVNAEGQREVKGGVVSFDTARDGKTVTKLSASPNAVVTMPATGKLPGRVISAPALAATGDEKNGLTKAVFSGGASFEENQPAAAGRPASMRTGKAQTLTLTLKGQLDAIEEALFQRDAQFRDGDIEGRADVGRYLESQGKLILLPDPVAPRRPPTVTHEGNTVDATTQIDVMLDTDNLYAKGAVRTVSAGSNAKAKPGSLFSETDKMYGSASEFSYDDARSTGKYVGTDKERAEVWQGPSKVTAVTIELSDDTQDLSATGHVESTFVLTDTGSKGETTYVLTADQMDYKEAARVATYVGTPAELKTTKRGAADPKASGADTIGRTIVLTLASDSRSVDTLEARESVYSTLADGSEALADVLRYESRTDSYTLRGKAGRPIVLRNRDTSGKCTETTRAQLALFKGGEPTFPEGRDNPEGAETRSIACGGSLRPQAAGSKPSSP